MKIILILLISLFINLFAKPLHTEYKVVVLEDWKPYYFINEQGKPDGYAIEHFEALAANMGLKYKYLVVKSWKEALRLFDLKKVDIIPNIGITPSREQRMLFSEPTDLFTISLFKKNDTQIDSTLKDAKIGVVLQNACNKLITEKTTNYKIIFQTFKQSLHALQNDEIDVMCYPQPLMEQVIQEKEIYNISSFGKPLHEITRAIAVQPTEIDLLEMLNKEILRLKIDGTYIKIYSKWFEKQKDIELSYQELALLILSLILIFLMIIFITKRQKLLLTQNELQVKLNEKEKKLLQLQDQKLQDQKILLTQSKIAAVGEMIGNISHQWRQPLSIISTHTSSMRLFLNMNKTITNDEINNCARKVEEQTMYLSETISDFRDFFKADTDKVETIQIQEMFTKLYALTSSIMKSNYITYIENIDENINIILNQNIMIQALINIYNNSKDAFIEKETLYDERYFFVNVTLEKETIVIKLKDSAGGLNNNIEDKIFEPYFTTKHPSIGTGIGLYMTHQIITKQLKGTIKAYNCNYVYNNKDLTGLEFVIKIPLKL